MAIKYRNCSFRIVHTQDARDAEKTQTGTDGGHVARRTQRRRREETVVVFGDYPGWGLLSPVYPATQG